MVIRASQSLPTINQTNSVSILEGLPTLSCPSEPSSPHVSYFRDLVVFSVSFGEKHNFPSGPGFTHSSLSSSPSPVETLSPYHLIGPELTVATFCFHTGSPCRTIISTQLVPASFFSPQRYLVCKPRCDSFLIFYSFNKLFVPDRCVWSRRYTQTELTSWLEGTGDFPVIRILSRRLTRWTGMLYRLSTHIVQLPSRET